MEFRDRMLDLNVVPYLLEILAQKGPGSRMRG